MASITINGDIAELALFAKLSNESTMLDSILSSDEEEKSLGRTLDFNINYFSRISNTLAGINADIQK